MIVVPFSGARSCLTENVNQVSYTKKRVILTRRGKKIVAIVSTQDLAALGHADGVCDEIIVPFSKARSSLTDIVNRVVYGEKRVVLTRRGKKIAAIISMKGLAALQQMYPENAKESIANGSKNVEIRRQFRAKADPCA